MSNCDLAQRFIRMVADAGLPTPDESWREAGAIALRWSDTGFVVPLDPDREDLAPLDELEGRDDQRIAAGRLALADGRGLRRLQALAGIHLVPRISEFYGIVIEMYFADHPPPHFHASYGGESAKIAIRTREVIAGRLPGRTLRLVRGAPSSPRARRDAPRAQLEAPDPIAPLK